MARSSIHISANGGATGPSNATLDPGSGDASLYVSYKREAGDTGNYKSLLYLHRGILGRLGLQFYGGQWALTLRTADGAGYIASAIGGYPDTGNWHAVAGVYVAPSGGAAGSLTLYVDGTAVATGTVPAGAAVTVADASTTRLQWGDNDWATQGFAAGQDARSGEAAVWHRALSDAEAKALTGSGHTAVATDDTGLLCLYRPASTDTTTLANLATGADSLGTYTLTLTNATVDGNPADWETDPPTGAPTLALVGKTETTISVSWAAVAGAASYDIFKDGTLAGNTSSLSYTLTGLTGSTTYGITAKARNGGGVGPASDALSVTTDAPPVAVPDAPTGLSASGVTATGALLSWNAVTGAASYRVYNGTALFKDGVTATSAALTLSPSTAYTFTVKAVNSVGESVASNTVTVNTPLPPAPAGALTVRPLVRSIHFTLDPTQIPGGSGLTGASLWWRLPGETAWKPAQAFVRMCTIAAQNDPRWGTILPGAEEGHSYEYKVTAAGTAYDGSTADKMWTGSVTTLTTTEPAGSPVVIPVALSASVHDVAVANLSATPANNRHKRFQLAGGTRREAPFQYNTERVTALGVGGDASGWVVFEPAPGATVVFDGSDEAFDVVNAGKWTLHTDANFTAGMKVYKASYDRDPGHVYWERPNEAGAAGDGIGFRLLWVSRGQMAGGGGVYMSSGLVTEAGYNDSLYKRATEYPEEGAFCYEGGTLYIRLQDGVDPNTVFMKIPKLPDPFTIWSSGAPAYGIKVKGITVQYFGVPVFQGDGTPYGAAGDSAPLGGLKCSGCERIVYEDVTVKGFGQAAFQAAYGALKAKDVIWKNCKALLYGLDPASHKPIEWDHLKGTNSESYAWVHMVDGASVLDAEIAGTFNGLDSGGVSSGYGGGGSQFWEVDNPTFTGVADDCLEPDNFPPSYIASRAKTVKCYKGISLAPVSAGPVWILRTTFFNTGHWGARSYKEAATKLGNYEGMGTADVGEKLIAHNTFVNAHTAWQTVPGVTGLSSSGVAYNIRALNNYFYGDNMGVDFADGGLGYPHTFDHNWYGLAHYGAAQTGLGAQAGRWGLSRISDGDIGQETALAPSGTVRRYTTFLDWQQGRDAAGVIHMPGYVAGVVPETPVAGPGGTWLHDPHSVYEARTTSGLVDPANGDFSVEAGSAALGLGEPLDTINRNCLPGWAAYETTSPTAGAVQAAGSAPAEDTTPPVPGGVATTARTATTAGLAVGLGSDNVGVTSRVLTNYSDSGRTTPVGDPVTLAADQTAITLSGLTAGGTYYPRVVYSDAAGNTANGDATIAPYRDNTPPVAGAVTVTAHGAHSLTLSVGAGTDDVAVTSRVLHLYSDSGHAVDAITPITLAADATSYTVNGLTASTTYYVRCVYSDAAGNRANGDVTAATDPEPLTPDTTPPVAALPVVGAHTSSSLTYAVDLGTDDNGVTSRVFRLWQDAACSIPNGPEVTLAPGQTSVTVSWLEPSTTYYGRVVYKDAAGNETAVVTAGTTDADPVVPEGALIMIDPEYSVVYELPLGLVDADHATEWTPFVGDTGPSRLFLPTTHAADGADLDLSDTLTAGKVEYKQKNNSGKQDFVFGEVTLPGATTPSHGLVLPFPDVLEAGRLRIIPHYTDAEGKTVTLGEYVTIVRS